MSGILPPVPPSPGFGLRRKNLHLPTLPASAFTPPNSGTSDKFPLPPSPSTVHPDVVIDAHVSSRDLGSWKKESAGILGTRTGGVVVVLENADNFKVESEAPLLAVVAPFSLESTTLPNLPSSGTVPGNAPISLSTVYTETTPQSIESLQFALANSRIVDIDVGVDLTASDAVWESFEDLLMKATADLPQHAPIVLSNLLPPPHDLHLPIVKLMNHPTYRTFQSQIASLSLVPNLYVKFLPPAWNTPTPPTPTRTATAEAPQDNKEKKEWKRRIKMYLGPVVEAFGYQRIIFGSSPSSTNSTTSAPGDWYEIARESFAELGVEQEAIDSVFAVNAKKLYGES